MAQQSSHLSPMIQAILGNIPVSSPLDLLYELLRAQRLSLPRSHILPVICPCRFRMTNALTIIRLWRGFVLCVTVLGLNWCVTPAMSFADVPLQENYPVPSPPAINSVWTGDMKGDKRIAYSSMAPREKDACFSIEDGLNPRRFDGKRALLLPLTTVCVGL